MNNTILRESSTFGDLIQLQYGEYAKIDAAHLKSAEEGSFLDRYRVMLFVDETNNNVIVMKVSLWHRMWATMTNLFCCCGSYVETLTKNVQARLITAEEVREQVAKTANTANTLGIDALDTRPKTPLPSGPVSVSTSKNITPPKLATPPAVLATTPPAVPATVTTQVNAPNFKELTDAMKKANRDEWTEIVDTINTLSNEHKDALCQHVSKEFGNDVNLYWAFYCTLFRQVGLRKPADLKPVDLLGRLEEKLLRLDLVVCNYQSETTKLPFCGMLPKKLVDIVLGENTYSLPLTDSTPHFRAMLNFDRNIVDPCGPVAGFDLLKQLAEHLVAHPSIDLQDNFIFMCRGIKQQSQYPNSKYYLTEAQRQTFKSILLPLGKLKKACQDATTAGEYIAALKLYDVKFVRHYAHKLLDSLIAIFNKDKSSDYPVDLKLGLHPYFDPETMLYGLWRAQGEKAIKILKALAMFYNWECKKASGEKISEIKSNAALDEFLNIEDIREMITLPDGMDMLHFLWMHCSQSARLAFLEDDLSDDILKNEQMWTAILNFCVDPQTIEENAFLCEEVLIKLLESDPPLSVKGNIWKVMIEQTEFEGKLRARYEQLCKKQNNKKEAVL